jgi:predicted Fe-Mo cluster-binding NifX family protein
MVICVAVGADGGIDPRWGRAQRVAVTAVDGTTITSWEEFEVGWNVLRAAGPEGAHHARVARFLREHAVDTVLAHHMGEDMLHMLGKMGITVRLGISGEARRVVTTTAA